MTGHRDLRTVASGFSFLEGPRWRDGRLFASDFYTRRVLSFAPESGAFEVVCDVPDQPSGLGFAADGTLLIVSMNDRRLLRWSGGDLMLAADLRSLTPGLANDMFVDTDGRAYVGNFGWDTVESPDIRSTCLVRVDPGGKASIAADGLVFPNGVVMTDGGRTLLVCETFAARITAFDRAPDGSLSNRRVWAQLGAGGFPTLGAAIGSGQPLPDGMAIDAEGCVWIGDAAGRGPLRVTEGGEIVDRVDTEDLAVFAVALGGADGRTLFMCASPPLGANDPTVDHRSALMACEVEAPRAADGNP